MNAIASHVGAEKKSPVGLRSTAMGRPRRRRHWQADNRPDARSAAPSDLLGLDRKLEFRPTLVQGLERAPTFQPRKLITETEMDARAEGHVLVRPSLNIERLGRYVCR